MHQATILRFFIRNDRFRTIMLCKAQFPNILGTYLAIATLLSNEMIKTTEHILTNNALYIFTVIFSYCIVFELEKVTKACKKDRDFVKMEKGKIGMRKNCRGI